MCHLSKSFSIESTRDIVRIIIKYEDLSLGVM